MNNGKFSLILWTLLGLTVRLSFGGSIVKGPTNQAAMLYENVNLTCQVSGSDVGVSENFQWLGKTTADKYFRIFALPPGDITNPEKYNIYGTYDLHIKNLAFSDGGNYGCSLWSGDTESADMLVFETPEVTAPTTIEQHDMAFSCVIRFSGPRDLLEGDTPEVEIMVPSAGSLTVYKTISNWVGGEPYTITANASYKANRVDDSESVTCSATTTDPSFQVIGNTTLDIQFPVEEPVFYPDAEFYYVGEVLNCSCNGNPTPLYTWVADSSPVGEIVSDGPYLDIVSDMEGDNTWTCTATNTVNGQATTVEQTISFTVYPAPDPSIEPKSGPEAWKIAVGVCVPLAVIIIVMIFVIIFVIVPKEKEKKRKKRSDPYSGTVIPTRGIPQTVSSHPAGGNPMETDRNSGSGSVTGNGGPYPYNHDVRAAAPVTGSAPQAEPQMSLRAVKHSPGYADLGVRHINNSYPGVNVSISREQSLESLDDVDDMPPPPRVAHPPGISSARSTPQQFPDRRSTRTPPSRPLPGQTGNQYYNPPRNSDGSFV